MPGITAPSEEIAPSLFQLSRKQFVGYTIRSELSFAHNLFLYWLPIGVIFPFSSISPARILMLFAFIFSASFFGQVYWPASFSFGVKILFSSILSVWGSITKAHIFSPVTVSLSD